MEPGRQPVQGRPVRAEPTALEAQGTQGRIACEFHFLETGGGHVQGGVERAAAGGPGTAGRGEVEKGGEVQSLDREVGAGNERVEKRLAQGGQVDEPLGLQAAVLRTGAEGQGIVHRAPGQAAREADLAGQRLRTGRALVQGDETVRTVHPHGQPLPPGQRRGDGRLRRRGGRGRGGFSLVCGRGRPGGEQGEHRPDHGQFAEVAGGEQQGEQPLVAPHLGGLGPQPELRVVPAQAAAAERLLPAHRAPLDLQGSGQAAVHPFEQQRRHRPQPEQDGQNQKQHSRGNENSRDEVPLFSVHALPFAAWRPAARQPGGRRQQGAPCRERPGLSTPLSPAQRPRRRPLQCSNSQRISPPLCEGPVSVRTENPLPSR